MKKIAILVPKGDVMPGAIIGAYFLLTQTNVQSKQNGGEAVFDLDLLGFNSETLLYDGSFSVKTKSFKSSRKKYDLLILPGFTSEMNKPIELNKELISWLKKQHERNGTELASMCTGAFLLAETGLLEGKKCTSHWAFESDFRKRYPNVKFMPEYITTDDQGFYTSGGAYSSLNLILYLIEKFAGAETSVWLSKVFQLDKDRQSQKPFVIFHKQKSHADPTIGAVQDYVEKHYGESLSIKLLAEQFACSRRNFIRRFKEATGNTPNEYIQRVRIEAAKRLLETSTQRIGEIMQLSGYQDSRSFRLLFKKFTGYTPSEYRRRYNRTVEI